MVRRVVLFITDITDLAVVYQGQHQASWSHDRPYVTCCLIGGLWQIPHGLGLEGGGTSVCLSVAHKKTARSLEISSWWKMHRQENSRTWEKIKKRQRQRESDKGRKHWEIFDKDVQHFLHDSYKKHSVRIRLYLSLKHGVQSSVSWVQNLQIRERGLWKKKSSSSHKVWNVHNILSLHNNPDCPQLVNKKDRKKER